jgi:hypothetical protein
VLTSFGGHGGPPYCSKHSYFDMKCQDVSSRFNLIIIVLELVLEIRILWVARDEDDDEALAQ